MTDRHPFIKWLKQEQACLDGIQFAKHYDTPAEGYAAARKRIKTKGFASWLLSTLGYKHNDNIKDCWCTDITIYPTKIPATPWAPRVAVAKRTKVATGKKAPAPKRKVTPKAKKGTN